MVRRIVEGMTLKSEESRLRERPKLVPTTTVDMASIGSPDIGSSPPESHDRRVTQTEDSCDIVGGSCDSHVTEKSPSSIAASSPSQGATCELGDNQSDQGSVTSSVAGRRGRGKGKGRAKRLNTQRQKSTATTPILTSRVSLRNKTPDKPITKPRVVFTGVIDSEGEETVRQLGGEMVDSVYNCTHLVTDKVRRTVKFLCCLALGCHIVSDQWLVSCREEGEFVSSESYLIRDRTAERQHKFSLSKSLALARSSKLLTDYTLYLSPSIKPTPSEMSDIVRCSGGNILPSPPNTTSDGLLIVGSLDDREVLGRTVELDVPIYTPELILSGVLRQKLDLQSNLLDLPGRGASVSSPAPSSGAMATAGRRKRKMDSDSGASSTQAKRKKK